MKHYEITELTTRELTDLRQAVENEILQRETQIAILTDTLESLLAAGANDAVIDNILQTIDILDAATPDAVDRDDENRCTECGAHIAEPHNPECPNNHDEEDEPENTRKQTINMLRAQGYNAPGFDGLVTLYHRDLAEMEWRKAEDATRGHMTRSQYAGNYDTRRFWFCNMRELRKYASDELLTWFDDNGRLTRALLRDNLLNGNHYAGSGYINNR